MTTDYATAPVTGSVYGDDGGLDELMVDAWMGVDPDMPPDLNWADAKILTMGPRHLFLTFEQGCNAGPYVFALKSDPGWDLTSDPAFGLHYLADDQDGYYPQVLLDFYRPVAERAAQLAGETSRPVRDRGVEVMTLLLDRIAELGILRAQEFDDDGGELIGLDRDIAAELPAAWAAKVAEETA